MIDSNSKRTEPAWRSAGIGMSHGWRCWGCNVSRSTTLGSKGAGIKKRCSFCVAAAKDKANKP